jgi:hypothetical protein
MSQTLHTLHTHTFLLMAIVSFNKNYVMMNFGRIILKIGQFFQKLLGVIHAKTQVQMTFITM